MTASRASRLVLGSGGASSSDLVGDTLRWILPAAGVVLSLWVIAVPPPLPRIAGVLATLAVAAALGYRLRPGHAGHRLLPAVWIVASAVVVWWAGTPPGLPLLFVLWSGAAAIGLTGRAGALAHMLLAAVALGAALALAPGPTRDELRVQIWAITMAGLVSVGLLAARARDDAARRRRAFGRAFEDASIGMAVADLDMRVIEPNPAFCALLGRTAEEIIGRRVRQFTHPDDRDVNVSLHNELASGRSSSYRLVKRYLRPDGGVVWAQITVSLVRDRRRRPRYVYAQIEDITERRRAEAERERNSRALARRARLGEAAAELGRVALVVPGVTELADHMAHTVAECLGVDVCCVCQLDGDTLLTLGGVGLPDGRAAGRRFPLRERSFPALALATDGVLQVADVQADPRVDLSDIMRGRGVRGGLAVAVRDRGGDAGLIFAHDLGEREFDADEVAFVRVAGNVLGSAIERAKREADALHRAHHDPLTGLPNRDLFADRLGQALARARRGEAPPAVLLADLDQFKVVNDSLGHPAGDELLREIAPRLAAAVRANDTVARFGGDEFVILGDGVGDELAGDGARRAARRRLRRAVPRAGAEMYVTASIGVALAGPMSELDALLADADAALYRAKARGTGASSSSTTTIGRARPPARTRARACAGRSRAASSHLHYQPLIDLSRAPRRRRGARALDHPAARPVSPPGTSSRWPRSRG